ncbi:MAG: hypothetical protein WCF27_05900 [Gaiellaceae bacterium]
MSQTEPRRCILGLAVGAVEACTLERCAFWEPGGAVVQGGCVIDRLALDVRRPDVAAYLLEVRERLDKVAVAPRHGVLRKRRH